MSAKKILFPTDFSTVADQALSYAAELARERGAVLQIVHVEEPPLAYGAGEYYYGLPEPNRDTLRQMLVAVVPEDAGVTCEHRLLNGEPAEEIVRQAERDGVELIVMASHGRTGLSRLVMGSIAERVLRKASCPVLIYKGAAAHEPAAAPGGKAS